MRTLTSIAKTVILAAALTGATRATAHSVESQDVTFPSVRANGSIELEHQCTNGYAVAGGFEMSDKSSKSTTFAVTGSYPSSTRSWTIKLTNRSGRPTTAQEASGTLHVTCGNHH